MWVRTDERWCVMQVAKRCAILTVVSELVGSFSTKGGYCCWLPPVSLYRRD